MSDVQCLRCGQQAPKIEEASPYPGELGQNILKHICQACWQGWRKFSVNVINDYKLRPFLPQDRAIVEKHMKQYLNLELSAQPITLTGQEGKTVTFNTPNDAPKTEGGVTREQVVDMLEQVYDPEIPVNVHDLGLIYDIQIKDGKVDIKMSLTSRHCPAAQSLPANVKEAVLRIKGVKDATVEVVWDPPWTRDRITEEGKEILGV